MTTRADGYATGRARREHIITAATDLFARLGYRSATVGQIAEAAGISRTGLLHHFPGKEELLEAVLARRDADDAARFAAAADESGLGPLRELVAVARHNESIPHLVALFATLSAEASDPAHPARGYFQARYSRTQANIAVALRQAQASGLVLAGVDPDAESRALIALMDGLQVQWLLAPDLVDMPAIVAAKLHQLLTVPLGARAVG